MAIATKSRLIVASKAYPRGYGGAFKQPCNIYDQSGCSIGISWRPQMLL